MEKKYIFDLKALMDFVVAPSDSRNSNSEITEMYMQDEQTSDLILTSKELREIKSNGSEAISNVKYDLLKMFITILDEVEELDYENLSFLQKIIFNTFLSKGLIKEITE